VLFVLLGLHAVLALAAPVVARRAGRAVFLWCALAPAATVAWAAAQAPTVLDGAAVEAAMAWVPSLGLAATLRLDAFALLMVALVSGIGVLVFVYAYGYFTKPPAALGRFAAALTAFAGAMLGVVLADNLLLLFVFWEATSVTSYLLIGHEDEEPRARDAALQALLTTGGGGLALLGGLVLLGQAAGTYELSELAAAAPAGPAVHVALALILLGCFTKSAQVPFHTWLPGAMAAPTPVSAYLHSATMVKAGVYLVARLAPIVAAVGVWRPAILAVGLATMVVGGYRALRQTDLKLLLAFGTVSQLGFLTVLLGLGTADTTFGGTALLLAHGLFKATLFMVVGVIDKQAGTRDLRELARVHARLRPTVIAGTVAAASMAGLPPLFGFIAKEAVYEALLHEQLALGPLGLVAIVGIVGGSVLTFAYSARFVAGLWGRGAPDDAGQTTAAAPPKAPARPAGVFAAPGVVLAALTVALGALPLLVDALVHAAARALDPAWVGGSLRLWHGLNLALALSGLTVAAGGGLVLARAGVARLQGRVRGVPDATAVFFDLVDGTLRWAKRVTGVVQPGSLPLYLGVILVVVVVLPGSALVRGGLPAGLAADEGLLQTVVGASIVLTALATATVRRRFPAVLLLGAVGFGVGLLFVVKGAPDLALTQFIVETLSLIIFVLVLRHLPDRFRSQAGNVDRLVRGLLAAGVAAFVFVFTLAAAAARTAAPVSEEYLARALPEGHGRNVVNVILVDFRALDTLGEVTVLVVAAIGIASLAAAARRDRRPAATVGDGETP
jgi:multicomponent Na+:H+ antiporter subunit A